MITVKTNDHERTLVAWEDLPTQRQAEFDYVEGEDRLSPRFVFYRGTWLDTEDTEGLAPHDLAALGWSTYLTDSFFSGVVFRHFDRDGNAFEGTVVVGTFYTS